MVVNNSVEKLGSFEANLDGYVTLTTFNTTVGSLATKTELNTVDDKFSDYLTTALFNSTVGDLTDFADYDSDSMNSLIDEINYINSKLIWHELTTT